MKNGPKSTPAAQWSINGEADPHAGRYDVERSELAMGTLSDDELANGAFMNYDAPLDVHGILAGTHSSPIAWMTAVKDRIRWLSRQLEAAAADLNERDQLLLDIEEQLDSQFDAGSLGYDIECRMAAIKDSKGPKT